MNTPIRARAAFFASLLTASAFAAEVETIAIKTLRAQMRYHTTKIEVAPGQMLKLIFENDHEMPHNLSFFHPGRGGRRRSGSLRQTDHRFGV